MIISISQFLAFSSPPWKQEGEPKTAIQMFDSKQFLSKENLSERHDCKSNGEDIMVTGTVKWFNGDKGFGFIKQEDGSDDEYIFVHLSSIIFSGYRPLVDGDKVKFDVIKGPVGFQMAENVQKIMHQMPATP